MRLKVKGERRKGWGLGMGEEGVLVEEEEDGAERFCFLFWEHER